MNYRVSYVDDRPDEVVQADLYALPDQMTNTSKWINFMTTHMNGSMVEAARVVRSIREADVKTIAADPD